MSNMKETFDAIRVADGEIIRITTTGSRIAIQWTDWQETPRKLTFHDVLAFDSHGIEGEDLSHAAIDDSHPFRQEALRQAGETSDDYHCFLFFTAWTDEPQLAVIARDFSIDAS